jgi:2-polyprenyl-6-methoxyphenol hydroxylase-like FAD-dependent oxidoreductase
MSPIAGVGINVAIQDAVEAANLLWRPLRQGRVRIADLARVQRRREIPVRIIQAFQGVLQERVLRPTLGSDRAPELPLIVRLGLQIAGIRDVPARVIALEVWRPHVKTPLTQY